MSGCDENGSKSYAAAAAEKSTAADTLDVLSALPGCGRFASRRPSVVYEEDIAVRMRRGSCTIGLRISDFAAADEADEEGDEGCGGSRGGEVGSDDGVKSSDEDEDESDDVVTLEISPITSSDISRRSSNESYICNDAWSYSPSALAAVAAAAADSDTTLLSAPRSTSRNTLRVPSSLNSSSSSIEEDPREIIRRRSLPKARSTECVDPLPLLKSRRYSANVPVIHGVAGGMTSGSYMDNFSRGRRASMVAPTADRDRLNLMGVLIKRRLSDQVC
jgi:hypothetical protein